MPPLKTEDANLIPIDIGPVEPLLVTAGRKLDVHSFEQEQSGWCWAATIKMLLDFFGDHTTEQCDIAFAEHGINDCGSGELDPDVRSNKGISPTEITSLLTNVYQFNSSLKFNQSSVAFGTLQAEINAGRPVQVGFLWYIFFPDEKLLLRPELSDSGHVVVIWGWETTEDSGEFLYLHDPIDKVTSRLDFSQLLGAEGFGQWSFTWTQITRP